MSQLDKIIKFVSNEIQKVSESQTASKEDKISILEITIDELRRTHDWLDRAYGRMKARILTYIGGGLISLTFLYQDGDTFIPHQTYGKIFYFIGLFLIISALITLLYAVLPRHWEFSIEEKDLEELSFASKLDYLEYVKKRYLTAQKMNLSTYESNQKLLNMGFFPLIFGAIILAVLNIFGT